MSTSPDLELATFEQIHEELCKRFSNVLVLALDQDDNLLSWSSAQPHVALGMCGAMKLLIENEIFHTGYSEEQ